LLPVCPSVCPSVSLSVRASNSQTKMDRKTKIGVNVPQGRSNRCANFQRKRFKVIGGQNVQKMTHVSRVNVYLQPAAGTRRSAVCGHTGVQWALDGWPHTCRHMAWRRRCFFVSQFLFSFEVSDAVGPIGL